MAPHLLAGVDIGGTKIAAGIADSEGEVLAAARAATPPEGGPAVVTCAVELVRSALVDARVGPASLRAVGVAVPAVVDRLRGVVLWAPNIAGWQRETPVAAPVAAALDAPVSLHYDGHAWAAGEWWRGAARGRRHAVLIAVGTGVGGGLILDGRLHRGRVGVAGALGWWVADWEQAGAARPESQGWLESLTSGPAIAGAAGRTCAEEAFRAAREGEPAARAAVARAAQALGAAVASLVSLVDPEVAVLGGGVIAGGGDLLLPTIRRLVAAEAQPQMREVPVAVAELGEDAAWLGAARLAWLQREEGA